MKKTLLLVDDEPTMRTLFTVWLGRQFPNLDVIQAVDGEEGLAAFLEQEPDCIITDFLMPKMDGFQLLEGIRESGKALTPIIFTTAYPSPHIQEDALALGACEFIDKTDLNEQLLCEAVSRALITGNDVLNRPIPSVFA